MKLMLFFLVFCSCAATLVVADQIEDDISGIKGSEGWMMPRRSVRSKTVQKPTPSIVTDQSVPTEQTVEVPMNKATRKRAKTVASTVSDMEEDVTASSLLSTGVVGKKSQKTTTVKTELNDKFETTIPESTDKTTVKSTTAKAKTTVKPTTSKTTAKTTVQPTTTKAKTSAKNTVEPAAAAAAAETKTTVKTTLKPTTTKVTGKTTVQPTTTKATTTAKNTVEPATVPTTKTTVKTTVKPTKIEVKTTNSKDKTKPTTVKTTTTKTTLATTVTDENPTQPDAASTFAKDDDSTTDKDDTSTDSTTSAKGVGLKKRKDKRHQSNVRMLNEGWQLFREAAMNDSALAVMNETVSYNVTDDELNVTSETSSAMNVHLSTDDDDTSTLSQNSDETISSRHNSTATNETDTYDNSSSIIVRINSGFSDMLNNITAQKMIEYIDQLVLMDVYNSSWDGFEIVLNELRLSNSYGEFSYNYSSPNSVIWSLQNGHSDLLGSYNCSEMESDSSDQSSAKPDVYSGLYVGHLSNVDAYAEVKFSLDERDNSMSAEIVDCDVTNADIDFSWNKKGKYRKAPMDKLIKSDLLPVYTAVVCSFFDSIINQSMEYTNRYFKRLLPIGSNSSLYLNASFVDAPRINISYADILLNGEVQGVTKNNFPREKLDTSNCNAKAGRCVFMGDYTMNTLLYQGFHGQLFNEPDNGIENAPPCVEIYISEPPTICISISNVTIVISGVVTSSFNESAIEDLHFNATGSYRSQINNNQLYGVVSNVDSVLSKAGYESLIGCLNQAVQYTMNTFFSEYRIPIPQLQYVDWVNSTISYTNRTQVISEDLKMIF